MNSSENHKNSMLPLDVELQFADSSHEELLPFSKVETWLRAGLTDDEVEGAELTVRIVDAEEGLMLNSQYRQKEYATNVLTFDYEHAPIVMADLVICASVVEQEAKEQGKTLEAHYAHMIIHGLLHAQGWDHEEDDEAEAMEQREIEILTKLGFSNPYA